MSAFRLINAVRDVRGISLPTKAVLFVLASHADPETGGSCYPSIATIAAEAGCSRRAVFAALGQLEDLGHLCRKTSADRQKVNYTIHPGKRCTACTSSQPALVQDAHSASAQPAPNLPRTTKPQKTSSSSVARARKPKWPTPPGVEDGQWAEFLSQRKKPLQERGYQILCRKLQKLSDDGWPPGDMIDRAIERGWETVFEPKEDSGGNRSNRSSEYLRGKPSGWTADPRLNGAEPYSLDAF